MVETRLFVSIGIDSSFGSVSKSTHNPKAGYRVLYFGLNPFV